MNTKISSKKEEEIRRRRIMKVMQRHPHFCGMLSMVMVMNTLVKPAYLTNKPYECPQDIPQEEKVDKKEEVIRFVEGTDEPTIKIGEGIPPYKYQEIKVSDLYFPESAFNQYDDQIETDIKNGDYSSFTADVNQKVEFNQRLKEHRDQIEAEAEARRIAEEAQEAQRIYEENHKYELLTDKILQKYNLTLEQFNVVKGIVIAESQWHSYEDAYAVINTLFNRINSTVWVNYIDRVVGENNGVSLYGQGICPGQFTVYSSGKYIQYMNESPNTNPGVRAIYDFLSEDRPQLLHNTIAFLGHGYKTPYPSRNYTSRGNNYGVPVADNEFISLDFDMISEQEIEAKASEAEAYCASVQDLMDQGMSEETAVATMNSLNNQEKGQSLTLSK